MGFDEGAFERLYPSLRRFASVVCPPDVDPDDLVQEAPSRTLRTVELERLEAPVAHFRRTIVRIASNHRRSVWRKNRAYARIAAPGAQWDEYHSDLDELNRLRPTSRAVLYMSVVEGFSYREIAEMIGSRETAVKARASRALRRLRVRLAEDDAR